MKLADNDHHPDCACTVCEPQPAARRPVGEVQRIVHPDGPFTLLCGGAEWQPTPADLDAQVRALHRQVGELHLVVARAMDGEALAQQREEAARRGQVEAEAAVDRVRALLDRYAAACHCPQPSQFGHVTGCPGLAVPLHLLRSALDAGEGDGEAVGVAP